MLSSCPDEYSEDFFTKELQSVWFQDFEQKIFGLFGENFRQVCQNCIFGSPEERFDGCFWKKILHLFRTSPAENYPKFAGKFLVSLSKMQSECPVEIFEENELLRND